MSEDPVTAASAPQPRVSDESLPRVDIVTPRQETSPLPVSPSAAPEPTSAPAAPAAAPAVAPDLAASLADATTAPVSSPDVSAARTAASVPHPQPGAQKAAPVAQHQSAQPQQPAKKPGPKIDLKVVITQDDLLSFNRVWARMSGEHNRAVWGARAWALVPIAAGLAAVFFQQYIVAAVLVVLGVALALAAGPYYQAAVKRAVSRQAEGTNTALLGPRRIVIDSNGIFEGGKYDRMQIAWPGVVEIVVGRDAFYVFYGSMQAIIVPRKAFVSGGQFEAAIAVVERLAGHRATDESKVR